jgi:uncharacterized membrane protein YozB (DUF420 family)
VEKISEASSLGASANNTYFTRKPIYGKLSIFLLGLILITLIPHYGKIADPDTQVPLVIIIHGILYLIWFVLFAVQCNLVAKGNVATHKKLGYASLGLFALLLISGLWIIVTAMLGYDPNWDPAYLFARTNLLWGVFHTIIFFSVFYALGVVNRQNLHAHKRFMLLASLTMVPASVTRIAFLNIIPINGTLLTLGAIYGFLLTVIIMDKVIFKRVHSVFKWWVPIYLVTQIICIGIIPTTAIGKAIAFPFH